MSEIFHTVIGLPRSGKTTFLAALWHLITAGEVSTKLIVKKLVGNTTHLDTISERWRRCEEITRTSIADETAVTMFVHEPLSNREYTLKFPDLSGESFNQQVRTRECTESYVEGLNSGGGLVLFVTANRPSDGLAIVEMPGQPPGADGANGPPPQQPPAAIQPWKSDSTPEQVRLVELLQFLQRKPFARRQRKVALIISAWDTVLEPKPSPPQWIFREMPLLHQFMTTNPNSFLVRVYGVSAQGGDVKGAQRDALLRQTPSERILCLDPETRPVDLTEPIQWLTQGL